MGRTLHLVANTIVTYEVCDTCHKPITSGSAGKWVSARKSDGANPVNAGCLCYHQSCELPQVIAATITQVVGKAIHADGGAPNVGVVGIREYNAERG